MHTSHQDAGGSCTLSLRPEKSINQKLPFSCDFCDPAVHDRDHGSPLWQLPTQEGAAAATSQDHDTTAHFSPLAAVHKGGLHFMVRDESRRIVKGVWMHTCSDMPSMTCRGSMTLPRDFDIFLPCASRTMLCRYTWLKGTLPGALQCMSSLLLRDASPSLSLQE